MKSWYLMNNTPSLSSGGFESDYFNDYNADAIIEMVQSAGQDVIRYNHDLSESNQIKCIIQGTTFTTVLNSMDRTIVGVKGTFNNGDYIYYDGGYWLIDGRTTYNGIFAKSTMSFCQYLLRWQNEKGNIISRWCNLTTSSKYDVGVNKFGKIITPVDDFTVIVTRDSETMNLEYKRVFIDTNTDNPSKVFELTRHDDSLFYYGSDSGIISMIADRTEIKETDNKELMICDYIEPTTPIVHTDDELSYVMLVIYGSTSLTIGGSPRKIQAKLYEGGVYKDNATFTWQITSEYIDYIHYEFTDTELTIWVDNGLNEDTTVTIYAESNTGYAYSKTLNIKSN